MALPMYHTLWHGNSYPTIYNPQSVAMDTGVAYMSESDNKVVIAWAIYSRATLIGYAEHFHRNSTEINLNLCGCEQLMIK